MTELLLEFLHYSYSFYTCLLDEHGLFNHKVVWLESLGDLARYRMAVAHLLNRQASLSSPSPQTLSSSAIERINQTAPEPQARIDDEGQADWGDEASVGMAALDDIETDEVEIWKRSALEWYSYALMEAPENGRIHHHLALLHKGDDLKSLYHFCKRFGFDSVSMWQSLTLRRLSLSAASPHLASNESILAMFDSEDQARRISPEADSTSLFVYLQGLLFTRVSLDRFNETLDRFLEQIERQHFPEEPKSHPSEPLKQLTSVRWMMIATIAVSAMTVFGKLESSLAQALKHGRSAERERRTRNTSSSTPHTILSNPTSKADKAEDEAESDTSVDVSDDASQPMQQLRLDDNTRHKPPHNDADAVRHSAQRLAFRLLGLLAKHPTLTYAAELNTINPCIVVLLTFLSRLFACAFKQTFALVERDLPWPELVHLFNQIPADVVLRHDPPAKVIGAPLPEDWCLRGMDWTERGLYSRGFWKSRSHATTPDSEFAVLESEAEEHFAALLHIQIRQSDSDEGVASGRWKRVASAGSVFVRHVPGLTLELDNAQGRKFKMSSVFSSKVAIWKKEDVAEVQQRKVHQITASAGANGVEEILVTDESEGEGDGPLLHSIKVFYYQSPARAPTDNPS